MPVSGGLESEGLESGGLESRATDFGSGIIHSGGLETRATDFGFGIVCIWSGGLESGGLESGGLESGSLESGDPEALEQPISDLDTYMPALKKNYKGPFNRRLLFRDRFGIWGCTHLT